MFKIFDLHNDFYFKLNNGNKKNNYFCIYSVFLSENFWKSFPTPFKTSTKLYHTKKKLFPVQSLKKSQNFPLSEKPYLWESFRGCRTPFSKGVWQKSYKNQSRTFRSLERLMVPSWNISRWSSDFPVPMATQETASAATRVLMPVTR